MNIRRPLTMIALASAVIVGMAAVPSTAFASGFKVPFTDPNQVGSLTLCNPREQPITSGSLLAIPFVWRAVSSARAPKGYSASTLEVFQPIQYVQPADWTGYQLTDDATFSNPAHPMAQATYHDAPLLWPDQSIPPHWDGLFQLRMIFSGVNEQAWTSSYPTAVIKVTGYTWTLVQGGGSSCTDGSAVSVESSLLPKSETAVPQGTIKVGGHRTTSAKGGAKTGSASTTTTSPTGNSTTTTSPTGNSTTGNSTTGNSTTGNSTTTTSPAGNSTTTTQAAVGSSTTTTTAGGSSSKSADPPDSSSKGGGSSAGSMAGAAIAVLVLACATALFFFRRRRRLA